MNIVKINALTVPGERRKILEQRFAARKGFASARTVSGGSNSRL
ncbi:hypothetical protein [Streptomyces sp. NBC_01187]